MRASTWQGTHRVSVETVPDPQIQKPTDAIVRMTSTAICGSDLHLYDVLGMYLTPGDIIGHEPGGPHRLTAGRGRGCSSPAGAVTGGRRPRASAAATFVVATSGNKISTVRS